MDTVQVQCGNCGRVMAVSYEHLGSQVHCPHCQAVVEAPPVGLLPRVSEDRDHPGVAESIFAGPEATDDIFGSGPSGPGVEMPQEKKSVPLREVSAHEPRVSSEKRRSAPFDLDQLPDERTPAADSPHGAAWTDATVVRESLADDVNLVAMRSSRVVKRSALAPILLIFLVPYALLATGVIIFLLLNQSRPIDPLERLPDPKPKAKDGGPRYQERVQHDSPLPAKLKTRLREPLSIGALQITPLKVQWTMDALVLHLQMKNVSRDQIFNPVCHEFLKDAGPAKNGNRPYTYLDWGQNKIYGGFSEWLKGPDGKEGSFGGDIGPGEREVIRITTVPQYQDEVKRLVQSRDALLWRVQVRRGFVDVRGNPVSATAVVGVEFSALEIDKES
jgi:hypothetical protein